MKNTAIFFSAVFVTFGMTSSVILGSEAKKVVAVVNGEEISHDTLANVLIYT